MEIWKDIPGYEGLYQVSDCGNVRSLNFRHTGKIQNLKPILHHSGYLQVRLFSNGKFKNFGIHVLISMTFLGHIPKGHKKVIDHINGNKLDNKLKNLQITTNRINRTKAIVRDLPTGVTFMKHAKKYLARIRINGKRVHLGLFLNPEEASQAYQNKLKEITQ